MEVAQVLPMNGSVEEASYANNSLLQVLVCLFIYPIYIIIIPSSKVIKLKKYQIILILKFIKMCEFNLLIIILQKKNLLIIRNFLR